MNKNIITIKGRLLNVPKEEKERILDLMRLFCSSKRYAFNRIVKDNADALAIEKDCYSKFIPNIRYSKDSVHLAKKVIGSYKTNLKLQKGMYKDRIKNQEKKLKKAKDNHMKHLINGKIQKYERKLSEVEEQIRLGEARGVIFGGKKNWKLLQEGKITKEEWKQARNNELYSRADTAKKGNPNLRIVKDNGLYLRISDPVKKEKYMIKLYIPEDKLQYVDFNKHSVLLKYQQGQFDLFIASDVMIEPTYRLSNGAIGVDINPVSINSAIVSKQGNYLGARTFNIADTLSTRTDKTKNIIGNAIAKVVKLAKWQHKGVAIEKLSFKDKIKYCRQNRIFKGFVYSKIIELFKTKCAKEGVEIKEVNPAYTSFIGFVKYSLKYNMQVHNASAYVIGRRGMKFKERLPSIYRGLLEPMEGRRKSKRGVWSSLKGKLTALKVNTVSGLQGLNMALYVGGIPTLEGVISGNSSIFKNKIAVA